LLRQRLTGAHLAVLVKQPKHPPLRLIRPTVRSAPDALLTARPFADFRHGGIVDPAWPIARTGRWFNR
jgi:hypothetical protein